MRVETLRFFRGILQKKIERLEKKIDADPSAGILHLEKDFQSKISSIKQEPALSPTMMDHSEAVAMWILNSPELITIGRQYLDCLSIQKQREKHLCKRTDEYNALIGDLEAINEEIEKLEVPLLHLDAA